MADYEPAVCNIGSEQQRMRRRFGTGALILALVYTVGVLATGQSAALLVGTVLLSFAGFLGVLQARMNFCVAFAAGGRYDFSNAGGETGAVDDADLRRQDRLRAVEITVYATLLAAVTGGLAYLAFLVLSLG